jgi:ParB family chromosome partitioning protein
VECSAAQTLFNEARRGALAALGLSLEERTLVSRHTDHATLLARLIALPDEQVMMLVALVMGETLAAGSVAVELAGMQLGIDMADWWSADDAFFDPMRDRQVLLELVAEVAGPLVADANNKEKTAVLKQIIRDHLDGAEGRAKCKRWVPRWMQFPPSAYTERGGVATVIAHARTVLPEPDSEPLPDQDAVDQTVENNRLAA